MIDKTISGMTDDIMSAMIHKTILEKLGESHVDNLTNILAHAYQPVKRYACECKHCEITLYTNTKRLNCEFCGNSDPEVFTCTELK